MASVNKRLSPLQETHTASFLDELWQSIDQVGSDGGDDDGHHLSCWWWKWVVFMMVVLVVSVAMLLRKGNW
jgi:hypothetical protein